MAELTLPTPSDYIGQSFLRHIHYRDDKLLRIQALQLKVTPITSI